MGIIDLISQLGGLFGLCLGFSFISFIEIFYWITIRLCRNIVKGVEKGSFPDSIN